MSTLKWKHWDSELNKSYCLFLKQIYYHLFDIPFPHMFFGWLQSLENQPIVSSLENLVYYGRIIAGLAFWLND